MLLRSMTSPDQLALHKLRMTGVINNPGLRPRGRALEAWATFLKSEIEMGTRFLLTIPDGLPYAVLGATGELVALPRQGRGGDAIFAYIAQHYGLIEHEEMTRFMYNAFRSHVLTSGTRVELRRFSAYNHATKTAYLHAYNGFMWRLTGEDKAVLVPNGEDDVFFLQDDGGQPIQDITEEDIAPHGMLFDAVTSLNFTDGLGGITPEQQRQTIIIWLFCLALPDLMPTKPLLMVEGAPGSGKSTATQMIQYALMGAIKPMILTKSKEDAFGILLLRSPIAVFDNTDSYIEWIPDQVCAYTTTGVFPRRKLYSDDEEVIIRPHSFIAVASKNPASFRREDVTDRSLVIRLGRREKFRKADRMKQEILRDRRKLFGEYMYYVNKIIGAIRAGSFDNAPEEETHRMADFSAIGRVVGEVLEWEPHIIPELMEALQAERDAFAGEEDPLLELLHQWIIYRPRGTSNIGREVTVTTLFYELESLAQAKGTERGWYKSPRMLAQKIRAPHVIREFDVEQINGGGHKTYKIYRKSDPKLGVLTGGVVVEDLGIGEA